MMKSPSYGYQSDPVTASVTVTVDIVVVRLISTSAPAHQFPFPEILLIQRGREPFVGKWALPGGKLAEEDLTLQEAALREFREETGLTVPSLTQLRTYGDRGRDPRGRFISVVFVSPILYTPRYACIGSGQAGSDASAVRWFPCHRLPELAFDHQAIVLDAFAALRVGVRSQ